MDNTATSRTAVFAISFLALSLTACGGGSSDTPCQSTIPGLCQSLGTAPINNLEILPKTLTTSDCTTNIPFIFTGGSAPFRVITSDNFLMRASNVEPLGSKNYFLLSLKAMGVEKPQGTLETVTVLDSQSRSARADINIPTTHGSCEPNPLLQTEPASANTRVSEKLAFQINGGQAPYQVVSNDENIVSVVEKSLLAPPFFFNAQAKAAGSALLTVTGRDGQNVNITFTVAP